MPFARKAIAVMSLLSALIAGTNLALARTSPELSARPVPRQPSRQQSPRLTRIRRVIKNDTLRSKP